MAAKTYRIKGGELRSVEPLVLRCTALTTTHVRLDGVDKGTYSAATGVRIEVDAGSGSQSGPTLKKLTHTYGATYTEVTFRGAATWSTSGSWLVVVSEGTLAVLEGASALPVTEADLQGANAIDLGGASDPNDPHRP